MPELPRCAEARCVSFKRSGITGLGEVLPVRFQHRMEAASLNDPRISPTDEVNERETDGDRKDTEGHDRGSTDTPCVKEGDEERRQEQEGIEHPLDLGMSKNEEKEQDRQHTGECIAKIFPQSNEGTQKKNKEDAEERFGEEILRQCPRPRWEGEDREGEECRESSVPPECEHKEERVREGEDHTQAQGASDPKVLREERFEREGVGPDSNIAEGNLRKEDRPISVPIGLKVGRGIMRNSIEMLREVAVVPRITTPALPWCPSSQEVLLLKTTKEEERSEEDECSYEERKLRELPEFSHHGIIP